MKRNYFLGFLLLAILACGIFLISTTDFIKDADLASQDADSDPQKHIEAPLSVEKEFVINGISIFESTYEQIADIIGKPTEIINVTDDNVVVNYGYFCILSYPDMELTINSNKDYALTNDEVVEIDIINTGTATSKGITVNASKDEVINKYSIEESFTIEADTDYPLSQSVIKGFKRGKHEINLNEYDEYCYIKSNEKPIALIFLLKDNIVKRILVRHLTAG